MKLNSNLMQSKSPCFVGVFLIFTSLFLLSTSMIAIPSASAHELFISTETNIANGQQDPAPIIESSDFASDLDKFDFTVDMGLTQLKFDSVAYIDSTHVRFNFHGVALEGTITISAEASAFNPNAGHTSNSIEIVVAAPLILQTISFANILPMKIGDTDQVIDVTASSSLDVVVESNTPSVCTIDFSKIHAVATGICSVKAIQTGNTLYAAATTVTKTIEVSANPTEVVAEVKPIDFATKLGSALYDPDLANDTYVEVLVTGNQSGSENPQLVKLIIPPQAISTKAVFLVSALSSDEESAAGYFVARITAVTSSGTAIRRLQKAIEINIPAGAKDSVPYWSIDGISWNRLQKLDSEVLPDNQHAGYFVEADGRIAIFTDSLMNFGFRQTQTNLSIISPVTKLALGNTVTLKSSGGSGTGKLEYESSTESICSITNVGVVTALGEGKCLVTAVKTGSNSFADARSNRVSISVTNIASPSVATPPVPHTGFFTHSFSFTRLSNALVLDVGLCSDFANEIADLILGKKDKSGSWSWKKISTTPLNENGSGVFTITNKFKAGDKLRIIANGDIQIESNF